MNQKELAKILIKVCERIKSILRYLKNIWLLQLYKGLSQKAKLLIHLCIIIILMLLWSGFTISIFGGIWERLYDVARILIIYREVNLTIIRVIYFQKHKKIMVFVTKKIRKEAQRELGIKNPYILQLYYYGNVLTLWYEMRKKLLIILRRIRYYAWRLNIYSVFKSVEEILDLLIIRLYVYPIYFFIKYIYLELKEIILWRTYKEIFLSKVYLIFIIFIFFEEVWSVLQLIVIIILTITLGKYIWSFILPNYTNAMYGEIYTECCELVNERSVLTGSMQVERRVWSEYGVDKEHGILDYYDIDGRFDLRFLKKLNRFYNQVFRYYGLLMYIRRNVTEEEWAETLLEERVILDKAIVELFKLTKLLRGDNKLPFHIIVDILEFHPHVNFRINLEKILNKTEKFESTVSYEELKEAFHKYRPNISFRINPERILNKTSEFKSQVSYNELEEAFHKYTYEICLGSLNDVTEIINEEAYKYFDKQMGKDQLGLIIDMFQVISQDVRPLIKTEFKSWDE